MASRAVARAFDLFLVGFTWFALSYVIFLIRVINDRDLLDRLATDPAPDIPDWLQVATAVALYVMLVAYELVCTLRWGQTAGKKILGMRIVAPDGRNPVRGLALFWRTSLWSAAIVALLVVPIIPPVARLLFALVLILAFVASRDRLNRTVFDRMAGTRVVCPRE